MLSYIRFPKQLCDSLDFGVQSSDRLRCLRDRSGLAVHCILLDPPEKEAEEDSAQSSERHS